MKRINERINGVTENTWIVEGTFFKSVREKEGTEEGLICMNLEPLKKDMGRMCDSHV